MLNNVKIKKALKSTVFKPLNLVNNMISKDDNLILLHISNYGIRHNLKPIKEYLIKNEYFKKYKIVCGIEDLKYADNDSDKVKYVTFIKSIWYFLHAKHVFYTAGQIPIKPSKDQIVIQMDHGAAAFKTCGALSKINNGDEFYFTYILAPSKLYVPILQKEYLCSEENVIICGEPMTDMLFEPIKKYDLGNYDKILLWMPTFRQSEYLNYNDSNEGLLPMFKIDEYFELDKILKSYNYKMIVKLHTAQNIDELSKIPYKEFSHLEILTNDEFNEKGYEIYELMKQVDAFLGDYSSVSLHFLFIDKPMAFIIPDIEEYKEKRGFVFEKPEDYMAGALIKEKIELYSFFECLSKNIDSYKQKRANVKKEIFKHNDGRNTERALEISGIKICDA